MTVNGFRALMKSISKRKPLGNIRVTKSKFSVGIDATSSIYAAIYMLQSKTAPIQMRSLIKLAASRCVNMIPKGTKPLFVFDGQRIAIKKRAENSLLKFVSTHSVDKIRDLPVNYTIPPSITHTLAMHLKNQGYDCIVAPFEADAQIAYLFRENLIQAALSIDADSLVFGCDILLENYHEKTDTILVTQRKDVASKLRFHADDLMSMQSASVLAGSDYSQSIRGLRFVDRVKIIHDFGSLGDFFLHMKHTAENSIEHPKDHLLHRVMRKAQIHAHQSGIDILRYLNDLDRDMAHALYCFQHHIVYDPKTREFVKLSSSIGKKMPYRETKPAEKISRLDSIIFGTIFPQNRASAMCSEFTMALNCESK